MIKKERSFFNDPDYPVLILALDQEKRTDTFIYNHMRSMKCILVGKLNWDIQYVLIFPEDMPEDIVKFKKSIPDCFKIVPKGETIRFKRMYGSNDGWVKPEQTFKMISAGDEVPKNGSSAKRIADVKALTEFIGEGWPILSISEKGIDILKESFGEFVDNLIKLDDEKNVLFFKDVIQRGIALFDGEVA